MSHLQMLNLVPIWLFMGFLCSYYARKKGRHPVTWFILGFCLSLFGLILLYLVPPLNRTQPEPKRSVIPKRSDAWMKMWYYMDPSHQQQGPIEFPDLAKNWKSCSLSENSLVWGEGMQEWKRLSEMPELIHEMDAV